MLTAKSDRSEFMRQITAHQGILYKVARVYGDQPEEREDLFQEILLNAWRSYASFAGRSSFSTWLYRVALNTALMHRRGRGRRPPETPLPPSLDRQASPPPDPDERTARLYRAIGRLGGVEKSVVLLYLEELSYREIADITGLSEGNVGVRLSRAKQKIREWMDTEEDHDAR